ncbi:MAG: FAD-linked oxidase C-terminal domain-containing protein [Acidobacteriaceae bacterium]
MAPARALHPAITDLKHVVGDDGVLFRPEELLLYEYDGSIERGAPECVVFPRTTDEVSHIVRLAHRHDMKIVPRGAGTGLSGGSIARNGGIVLAFARMNRIVELDIENERAVVQPGVVNLDLTHAAEKHGYYFAPDPSSQKACTIGGNVAENSGGPHTLSLGVTVNHVTGMTVVLPDQVGSVLRLGSKCAQTPGYDLTGFFTGSEGTLGIVTEIIVKLIRLPEKTATLLAIFDTIESAGETVEAITREGITPAALEMLDGWMLRTVEAATHAGYPLDSGAVLLIELEGLSEAVEEQADAVARVCASSGAREVRRAKDEREQALLWAGRKNAFGAIGRVAPSYYVQDGVIPRTKIAATLRKIEAVSKQHELVIGNIFHAGDGNLHPLILFDVRDPVQTQHAIAAGNEILEFCISVGGSITGEHGVGMEKQDLMCRLFSTQDLIVMRMLRDAFNPAGALNPNKLLPSTKSCRELSGIAPDWLARAAAPKELA